MSEPSSTARSSKLFGSALACGMLMGVLSEGVVIVVGHFFGEYFPRGGLAVLFATSSGLNFLTAAILLAGVLLYRRSFELLPKVVLCALGVSLADGVQFTVSILALRAGYSGTSLEALNILLLDFVPLAIGKVALGFATASLYGHPRLRWWFAGCAVLAGLLDSMNYVLFYAMAGKESTHDIGSAVFVMGKLISGAVMGAALAWPVEKLEREASVLKEGGL